jgi:hypothetical protein
MLSAGWRIRIRRATSCAARRRCANTPTRTRGRPGCAGSPPSPCRHCQSRRPRPAAGEHYVGGALDAVDGFEPSAVIGPLIDMRAVEKVERTSPTPCRSVPRPLAAAKRAAQRGTFLEPTVLADVTTDVDPHRAANWLGLPVAAPRFDHSVSWTWKAKIQVLGCVDVAPGRMSYWTPGRNISEGVS